MMLGISPQTYSAGGGLLLEIRPDSELETITRRVSRTATLDGNSSISDFGYSAADATLLIKLQNLGTADRLALEAMVKLHPLLVVSCRTGCYLGAVSSLNTGITPETITFLVKQKLSE